MRTRDEIFGQVHDDIACCPEESPEAMATRANYCVLIASLEVALDIRDQETERLEQERVLSEQRITALNEHATALRELMAAQAGGEGVTSKECSDIPSGDGGEPVNPMPRPADYGNGLDYVDDYRAGWDGG